MTAVRLGRRIYDNIRKAAAFIFAVHLPIAGLAIAPLLSGWPLILGPIHIALLEIMIDPVCSLAFEAEPEETDIMRRRPCSPDSPLISRALLAWSALQGAVALILLLVLAAWANLSTAGENVFRSTCFAGLIVSVFILVLANRSFGGHRKGHNLVLVAGLCYTAGLNAVVLFAPPFHLIVPGWEGTIAIAIISLALAGLIAAAKRPFGITSPVDGAVSRRARLPLLRGNHPPRQHDARKLRRF